MIYIDDNFNAMDLQEALRQLPEWRRRQALAFARDAGKLQCAASYLLLCRALRETYGISAMPEFAYEEGGKPFLKGIGGIFFNLSHCREAVACVVARRPVGVDIESIRPYSRMLAERVLSREELAQVEGSADKAAALTRLWTMKESWLKLTGRGIREDLKGALRHADALFDTVERKTYIATKAEYKLT